MWMFFSWVALTWYFCKKCLQTQNNIPTTPKQILSLALIGDNSCLCFKPSGQCRHDQLKFLMAAPPVITTTQHVHVPSHFPHHRCNSRADKPIRFSKTFCSPPPHHHQSLYWPWTLFHRIDRNSLLEGESFCFWEPHNQRKRRPCSVFFCAFSCHWLFWTLFRTLKWHHVLWLKSKATDRKSNCSKRSHEFEATLKKLTITHVLAFCAVIRVLVPSQQPFSFELPITQVARLIVIRGVFENLVTFELGWLHKLLTTGVTLKLSKIWKDIPTSNHVKEIDPSQKNKSVWILLVEWFFFVCKASPSFVLKWESQWPQ